MATVTFTGNASASNGTSRQVLEAMTHITSISFEGDAAQGNRIKSMFGANDGSGASFQAVSLSMVTLGNDQEVVTGLTGFGGTTSGTSTIVTITDLRISADFDNVNSGSAANFLEYQRAISTALAGDDHFILSGDISRIWGDFQTAPSQGTVKMGDDIFTFSGATNAAAGAIVIYGDAQTVPNGAKVVGGNDIIDAGVFFNVPCRFYGDFEAATGNVTYGNDDLFGGGQADILFGDSQNSGKAGGDDYLVGYGGDDHLFGGGGNDVLKPGFAGVDVVDGGAGIDTVDYRASSAFSAVMIVDLADASQNTNEAAGDTYVGIENLIGRNVSFEDDLRGNTANNKIVGLAGADTLSGRVGKDQLFGGLDNDRLDGGAGSDTLTGGPGEDHFVFSAAPNANKNVDKITDFKPSDDTIDLTRAIMTALPNVDELPAKAFFASNTGEAHDRNDRIIYEKDTGKLFYDADGSGGGKAVLFAILQGHPAITAADFEILL